MFEAQAAYYLNKYLGKYVDGVDPKSLRISVWAGNVVLTNLRIRPEALEELNLPITVKAGLLGTLRLKVRKNSSEKLCSSTLQLSICSFGMCGSVQRIRGLECCGDIALKHTSWEILNHAHHLG